MSLSARRHLFLPLVAFAIALATVGPATTVDAQTPSTRILHVSPDGQDPSSGVCQAGSEERPWGTLRIALHCLQPGDTLYVHEGTYRERVKITTEQGTADRPIVVTGAPGENRPVIEGGLRIDVPTWWTVQNLEIVGDGLDYDDGGTHLLKMLGGHHWTVRDVELHSAPTYALFRVTPGSDGSVPSNWRLLDSCIHDTLPKHGTPDKPPYPDHNIYIFTGDNAGPGLIEGNVVFGASNGQNLKLGDGGGSGAADNVTVRFNTFADAAQNVTVVGPSDNNVLERNVFADVNYGEPWYPSVRGIYLTGNGNVARNNAWWGAAEVVHNRTGTQTTVVDGGNRPVAAGFEGTGCDGLYPADSSARDHGAWAPTLVAARADQGADVSVPVERVAGPDRSATSVAVSREFFDATPVALLARGDKYPDALASSALSGLVGGPVLLSARDRVPDAVLAELRRLDVERVVLLGGESALGPAVVRQLRDAGITVERLAGSDRFETAVKVAEAVRAERGSVPEVVIAEGANADPARGWPDAVAAGQLAATAGAPLLLTGGSTLPSATRRWLEANAPQHVTVVGGPAAVPNAIVAEVDELAGTVRRLYGPDRYATAEAVATELDDRRPDTRQSPTFVASGLAFPDALSAAPAAAQAGGVLVLYGTGEAAYDRLQDFVSTREAPTDIRVVGGAAAVSTAVEDRWAREEIVNH